MQDIRDSYPMKVLDRHTKNVIYKTIKRIIENAKEEKKKAHIMSINLEWDEFRKFTSMQILGLLLLRDDALIRFQDFLFPQSLKQKGKFVPNLASLQNLKSTD